MNSITWILVHKGEDIIIFIAECGNDLFWQKYLFLVFAKKLQLMIFSIVGNVVDAVVVDLANFWKGKGARDSSPSIANFSNLIHYLKNDVYKQIFISDVLFVRLAALVESLMSPLRHKTQL